MNAKIVSAFCLLAGLLGGFKLGQKATLATLAKVPTAIEAIAPTTRSAIARPAAERQEKPEITPTNEPEISLELIAEKVRLAISNSNSSRRSSLVSAAVRDVPDEKIPELARLLKDDMNGNYGYTIAYEILPRWAKQDP